MSQLDTHDLTVETKVPADSQPKTIDLVEVFERLEAPLLRYVGHLLNDRSQAEDVVQEAFLRLHKQVQTKGSDSIKDASTWLYRVSRNLAMDEGRKKTRRRKAQPRIVQMAVDDSDEQVDVDTLGKLARAEACQYAMAEVERLPEPLKEVVLLKVIQGMTLKQIGTVTGVSTSNACYRLKNAMQTLASNLKESGVI